MSDPILPFAVWQSGTNQNSIPANDNALRNEVLVKGALTVANSEPGSPSQRDVHVVGTAWGGFSTNDVVIYIESTWYGFAPFSGWIKKIGSSVYSYSGSSWDLVSGGGGGSTQGKQAIYVSAAAMRPSVSGGCAALAAAATSANQPDLLTLDFDASTDEFAQFGVVMPKKWNAGTITARFHWTHGSTTTNFAVVWGIQAVAVGNDDAIGAAYGTAVTVTDTGGTTSDLYTSDETGAMTAAGTPAKEDMVYFRVYRDADAGGDTLAVDAKLIGVSLYVTTDADTDA